MSIFILSFTVVAVLATGIFSTYASVMGILNTFASRPRPRTNDQPTPAPAPVRARAAHAGGD
jgi:hypothetical protein